MPKRRLMMLVSVAVALVFAGFLTPLRLISHRDFSTTLIDARQRAFDSEVSRVESIAWDRMLANIGPGVGANDGIVVASPSTGKGDEPDYFYTWTRDAALVISTILPAFLSPKYLHPWSFTHNYKPHTHSFGGHGNGLNHTSDPLLEPLLRAYISSQDRLQRLTTRSGGLRTGGLNEPKFHVDESEFKGDWGRPQRDGPALRALAIIPYTHFLLDRGSLADVKYIKNHLYDSQYIVEEGKIIKNDLEEVAHGWEKSSFDLWEEVDGQHLWNLVSSIRALQAGAILALRLHDNGAAEFYNSQVAKMVAHLARFQDDEGIWHAMLTASITQSAPPPQKRAETQRTGLDCAVPLSYIHSIDPFDASSANAADWVIGDPGSLASMRAYLLSFQDLYPINRDKDWTDGWLIGRYAEDVYDGKGFSGGNPWFICTFATAQFFYLAQTQLMLTKRLHINNVSASFWDDVLDESFPVKGQDIYHVAASRIGDLGDRYLSAGLNFIGGDGRISEQIDRNTGRQIGARDLTWSYASFVSAAQARRVARNLWQEELGS